MKEANAMFNPNVLMLMNIQNKTSTLMLLKTPKILLKLAFHGKPL
jgi:hypothetical protein